MPGLIGKKIGMTSVYSAEGKNIPCTIIEAGPCVVTQVKKVDTDGYEAVQLAYGEKTEKNTPKAFGGMYQFWCQKIWFLFKKDEHKELFGLYSICFLFSDTHLHKEPITGFKESPNLVNEYSTLGGITL